MAGGTGSGVGSFLLKILSEYYPDRFLIVFLVTPSSQGEIIIQNYNSLFSLTNVYNTSNSVVMLNNDDAYDIQSHLMGNKKPTVFELN